MANNQLYGLLVPDAPLYRRTQGDEYQSLLSMARATTNRFLVDAAAIPGLQTPELVSSFSGSIEQILFCFPKWALQGVEYPQAYRSVISALRVGTKFVIVHHESTRPDIEPWFTSVGHKPENLLFVGLPGYVNLTDWAEDAYVSLKDAADGSSYLTEPWEFLRAGDALIADAVEQHSNIRATQAPLIFQGGNCLVGSDFWLLGKDYFADTMDLLSRNRPPVSVPKDTSVDQFAIELFRQYIDRNRKLVLIGTDKPIPIRPYYGSKSGADYYIDVAAGGAGTFQPIFHIDMFLSLVGSGNGGKFEIMIGSPALADKILGTSSPFALDDVYDSIADSLSALGFSVIRNPLVHRPKLAGSHKLAALKEMAQKPDGAALLHAIKELTAAGATDGSIVKVRDWHHITWNNCLVERSASEGKHVYLPTFGHGPNADLKPIDAEMKSIWEGLGFTVHLLGDFNPFAERQGVVHCIKKYLSRGK
jgi:hypothetical protein